MSTDAILIRDKALALLQAGYPADTFKTFRKTPMLGVNASDLPSMGVFILRERRTKDGAIGVGVPQFVHALTLGFSGAEDLSTDAVGAMATVEDKMSALDDLLLRDPTFLRMFEGVVSMDRVSQYAKVGEVTLAEVRIEMVLQFRSYLEPIINDDLLTVHVDSRFPKASTDPQKVQQVGAQYDLSQT